MAVLPIIVAPDPRLKAVCQPVDAVDADVRRLMDDLLDTMYQAPGIGLAAPQVGTTKRILAVDVSKDVNARQPYQMANPELLWSSGEVLEYEEGCLSFPEQFAEVARPQEIRVRYLDRDNNTQELEAEGLLATCIQHEMDHLDGVLFVEHISKLKRDSILRKLRKARKESDRESKRRNRRPAKVEA